MSIGTVRLRADLAALAAVGDDALDLTETALALAALERPQAARDHYRGLLAALAAELGSLADAAADVEDQAAALAEVMVRRWRFAGDDRDWDDPDAATLMRVIDRRRGPPLTLGILWLAAGRAQGWSMAGLDFPNHFLVRLDGAAGRRAILDPFHGGQSLDAAGLRALLKATAGAGAELAPDHYAAMSNREILVRLQNSIKLRLLRAGQVERALAAVEATLLFAPGQVMLWREAGMMHLKLGDLPRAVAALDQFVARAPNSAIRHRVALLLQDLKGRLP